MPLSGDNMKKKEQQPVAELVKTMMEGVNATGNFLDFLRQIGSFKFRATIQMTDTKLAEHIDSQVINMLQATREYYMMHQFLQRENLWARWEMFRAECQKEVLKLYPGEEGEKDA